MKTTPRTARFRTRLVRLLKNAALVALVGTALGVATPPAHGQARFDGHRIVRLEAQNWDQMRIVLQLTPDVWSHRVGIGGPVDVRIEPDRWDDFVGLGLPHEVLIEDVQTLIDAERDAQDNGVEGGWFTSYKNYNDVVSYLQQLEALRPDLVTLMDIGDSVQGRSIYALKITGASPGPKPGIVLNGCQHAREWVTVMSTTWYADQLIRNYDTDSRIRDLVDTREFYIIPISNPDGYVYTWNSNRLWRKNRAPGGGVDLNRNWAYKWGGRGASTSPNSDVYRGPYPFSEPETAAISNFISARTNIASHIDVHSYSQLILQPWGYTIALPDDHDTFEQVGSDMADAIFDVHGQVYRNGPVYTTIYPASGVMSDWTYGARRAFGLSYELRDRGQFGFILPPDQIIPTAEETFEGVLVLAEQDFDLPLLLDVGPVVRGQSVDMVTNRAEPGEEVFYFYSLRGDEDESTYFDTLNVTIDLFGAVQGGSAIADANGQAIFSPTVPNTSSIFVIWLQSATSGDEFTPGETSNVVVTQAN